MTPSAGRRRLPASIGVLELYHLLTELSGDRGFPASFGPLHRRALDVWERVSDVYHLVRYEAFVDGDMAALSGYLGFAVQPDIEVDRRWKRVTRSKSHGAWKHWFIDDDVAFATTEAAGFMEAFGFDRDQGPADERFIDPETSSRYVERIVKARRARDRRRAAKD